MVHAHIHHACDAYRSLAGPCTRRVHACTVSRPLARAHQPPLGLGAGSGTKRGGFAHHSAGCSAADGGPRWAARLGARHRPSPELRDYNKAVGRPRLQRSLRLVYIYVYVYV